jgi:protein-tyrosine phosphatase
MEGAFNVRDLGGYDAADHKTVKWGKVFRSGDLNQLTDEDLETLASIPLKTYIDFRDSAEIAAAPDKRPSSLVHEYLLPIETGSIIDMMKITAENASGLLVEGNKSFVRNNQDVYREFFRIMMDDDNAPLLFHCSAGKDRTGYGAALFLASLGVDRETIIQDYLLSAQYVKEKYAKEVEKYPVMEPLMTVKREYIEAAFEVIDKEYGGMENYLTKNLDVDLGKMKELYTE